jgi:hypothetical protein
MSINFMTLAWKTTMPSGRKLVLLALCDNANHQGECYPSVEVIARKCSMGQRTVQQHMGDLEAAGILVRHFRRGRSTLYKINPCHFGIPAESAAAQSFHPAHAISTVSPPQRSAATSASFAPITINEPSTDPLPKRQVLRGTRLAATWTLPKAWAKWALHQQPSWTADHVRFVADKFRDHWAALPGQRGVKVDWLATWRNWCRNEPIPSMDGSARDGEWWRSEATVVAKGAALGLQPLPGESNGAFKERILQAARYPGKRVAVPPAPTTILSQAGLTKVTLSSAHRAAALDAARALTSRVSGSRQPTPARGIKQQPAPERLDF